MPDSPPEFPLKLTQPQRKALAEIAPEFAGRLKLDEKSQRTVRFTEAELETIRQKATDGVRYAKTGMRRNSFRHIVDQTTQALENAQGIGAIPASERVYQFKITLKDSHPPIWRRIQIKDGTLDKLHEHIQTAMGWTNSHLHHFHVGEQGYGDPFLLQENFEEFDYRDSMVTKISDILPKSGERFRIRYEYDFGDSWQHEVLFEGCLKAEPGVQYPRCVEGALACPPEDVGGVWSYHDFKEAMADPTHEQHRQLRGWYGGPFDPEEFDPAEATKQMRCGLPNWRSERWV